MDPGLHGIRDDGGEGAATLHRSLDGVPSVLYSFGACAGEPRGRPASLSCAPTQPMRSIWRECKPNADYGVLKKITCKLA